MPYLDTFSGDLTAKEARHLIKKNFFWYYSRMVTEAVSLGLSATITKLFMKNSFPEPPLKYVLDDENHRSRS